MSRSTCLGTSTGVVKEVELVPRGFSDYVFHIRWVDPKPKSVVRSTGKEIMAIDLGIENLVACIDTTGEALLVKGRRIKSINQGYNKNLARLRQDLDTVDHRLKEMRIREEISRMTDAIYDSYIDRL